MRKFYIAPDQGNNNVQLAHAMKGCHKVTREFTYHYRTSLRKPTCIGNTPCSPVSIAGVLICFLPAVGRSVQLPLACVGCVVSGKVDLHALSNEFGMFVWAWHIPQASI